MKKKILSLMTILMLVVSGCPLYAKESTTTIQGTYYPPFTTETTKHDFDYDKKWFNKDASQYNQKLAQLSIGLANTGNHATKLPIDNCDQYIKQYTEAMGFENGESQQFNETPTKDTIGSYISSQKMDGYTLVCVGLRGQGYEDEWMSNFYVGDGTRHNGFDSAAQKVEKRIRAYLKKYKITGKTKLWIAGFSRAAAVSNITAADMIDSELFDDVFAYCFACPRTTKEVGKYKSIFNIVGTCDVVPMVTFADWGYGRYGIDKFISAQEVDSEYAQKILDNDVDHPNATIRNNVIVNHQLHVLCEYIVNLYPTSKEYVKSLQNHLIEAWKMKDKGSYIASLPGLLNELKSDNTDKTQQFDELIDYLMTMIGEYLQEGVTVEENNEGWNLDDSIGSNLFLEHNCQTYLNWMFASDNPYMIYTENTANMRFVVSSQEDVTVDIYDSYGYVQSVNSQGDIFYRKVENVISRTNDNIPVLYSHKVGTQVIIIIPEDQKYMLTLSSKKDASVEYFGTRYDGISLKGDTSKISKLNMKAGKSYFVVSKKDKTNFLSGDNDSNFNAWDSNIPYSPSLVMHLENMNVLHLTFQQMIGLVIGLVVFLVGLLLLNIITYVRRRIKHLKVNAKAMITVQVITAMIFFALQQIAGYYMPAVPLIKTIFGVLVILSAVLLAFVGFEDDHHKLDLFIGLDLTLCMIGQYLYNVQWILGVVCYLLAGIVFCIGFIRYQKPTKRVLLGYLLGEIVLAIVIFFVYRDILLGHTIIAFLYFSVLLARLMVVIKVDLRLIIVPILYAISNALFIYEVTGVMSIVGYLCFYVGAMLLAIYTWNNHDFINK